MQFNISISWARHDIRSPFLYVKKRFSSCNHQITCMKLRTGPHQLVRANYASTANLSNYYVDTIY